MYLSVFKFHISGIILSFCNLLFQFKIIFEVYSACFYVFKIVFEIYMAICRSSSFVLAIMYYSIVQRNHSLIIHSPPVGQLKDVKD